MAVAQSKLISWIKAFRLRTLPLALSCVALGTLIAAHDGSFNPFIFFLASLSTLLLQILANLANDYGDSLKGTDNDARIGPARTMQTGEISAAEMRAAIIIFSLLSLACGLTLIFIVGHSLSSSILFFLIGICALAVFSAISYTMGNFAYGYRGLGDVFVFIFFGLVGVCGSYFVQTRQLPIDILLPSASLGLLSMGVLNLNNMRDEQNDRAFGKFTVVVKMGFQNAKIYHSLLLVLALICAAVYVALHYTHPAQLLFLLPSPLILHNLLFVLKTEDQALLDPQLKKLAMSTFLFALCFGIGMIL